MIPLNVMTSVWAVLVPLAEKVPDPEDVKPGWLGFGVFLLLAAAVVFLAFSFRKQLRKVDFPEPGENGASKGGADNGGPANDGPGNGGEPGEPRTS